MTMKLLSVVIALVATASSAAFAPTPLNARSALAPCKMAAEELYIDQERRNIMNLIVVGSATLTVGAFGIPYIAFFVPPSSGDGSGGVVAKDALGIDIIAKDYLKSKPALDRSLAQGLKGDPT